MKIFREVKGLPDPDAPAQVEETATEEAAEETTVEETITETTSQDMP